LRYGTNIFEIELNVKLFFDQRKILAVVSKANLVSLRRTGAYIRKAARNKVSKSDKASMPGNPPHTRRGLLKTSLLFGVDKRSQSVFVGPAEKFIGKAMVAHEFGGLYRNRKYPKRPLMGPTLKDTVKHIPKFWQNSIR
jgi:hypothetical protein